MNDRPPVLEVQGVSKRYATLCAVDHVSFSVHPGEIFGLLGPNGAGKTTTIRMILDIIKPDGGQVLILGGPMEEGKKTRIGYLPEERGLYNDMRVLDTLLFLGQLKGLSRKEAHRRAEMHLRELDLWDARKRKIEALSRGMNQKVQFIAAVMHQPDLIIIDEPFSALDPVNTRLMKQFIFRMRDAGAGIVMCTHQMHQVEEMCQRILLINHGQQVLYGPLHEIRKRFSANAVSVTLKGDLAQVPGVHHISRDNDDYRLLLDEDSKPECVLAALVQMPGVTIERFEHVETSLDEIFIEVVGGPDAKELERR